MTQFQNLAVYCGSATPADPFYMDLARSVGTSLAQRGIGVVYGGGHRGLMGAVADSAMQAGGTVTGVIPRALVGAEVAHSGVTHLEIVETMHERKARFTDLSDGFITIPGGVGTMDELWEAVSWAQLGYHTKPVGMLNAGGFFDQLLAFNQHMIDTGFIRPDHANIIVARDTLDELLDAMAAYRPHRTIFAMKAEDLYCSRATPSSRMPAPAWHADRRVLPPPPACSTARCGSGCGCSTPGAAPATTSSMGRITAACLGRSRTSTPACPASSN
jgi:uncharacterized protein (TIGR00730 family)